MVGLMTVIFLFMLEKILDWLYSNRCCNGSLLVIPKMYDEIVEDWFGLVEALGLTIRFFSVFNPNLPVGISCALNNL